MTLLPPGRCFSSVGRHARKYTWPSLRTLGHMRSVHMVPITVFSAHVAKNTAMTVYTRNLYDK